MFITLKNYSLLIVYWPLLAGNWDSRDITVTAELNAKKYTGHVSLNRSEIVQFPAMIPYDFDMSVDYSDSESKPATKLVKITANQPKEGSINAEAQFEGPLQILGDFKGQRNIYSMKLDYKVDAFLSIQK